MVMMGYGDTSDAVEKVFRDLICVHSALHSNS
jgi:hypothetical protein